MEWERVRERVNNRPAWSPLREVSERENDLEKKNGKKKTGRVYKEGRDNETMSNILGLE